MRVMEANESSMRQWSEQKSLLLTPFSNFSHHHKICREAPLLPEPSQMSVSRDSCTPGRFFSDAGVVAARLKNSRFNRILK